MAEPRNLVSLVVVVFATIFCWSFWNGNRWVKLYFLALVVLVGLVGAAIGQVLDIPNLIEPANVLAIAFSFAGCAAGPTLWRDEIREDLDRTSHVYAQFEARDLLSWTGLLKITDRSSARGAALAYLTPLVFSLVVVALTLRPTAASPDRIPFLLALSPVAAFALLSAWYVYRATRRLVPGA